MICQDRPTVLVVDDQQSIRRFILRVLANRGYDVLEAGRAADAIELSRRRRIDLLIADVVMPDTSGPDLVRILASQGCPARVLMISGFQPDSLASRFDHATTPFLMKPFDPQELVKTVADILATSSGSSPAIRS
jgi:DNA-binding NtrC family response regulator